MFDLGKIQSAAIGLVGFRPQTGVDAEITATRTGLTFEQGSGLVNVENIRSLMADQSRNINDELRELISGSFVDVLNSIFSESDYRSGGLVYPEASEWESEITSDFKGYEIDPVTDRVSLVINKLMFEAPTGITGDVTVNLFNTQKKEAVKTNKLTIVEGGMATAEVNWILNKREYGGKWYIGYELANSPRAKNINLATAYNEFEGVIIRPVSVAGTFTDGNVKYVSDRCGLNLDVSIYDDYTSIVLSNERRFGRALQLMLAVKVADMGTNSTRSNRDERITKANAVYELDGNRFNKEYPEHTGLLTKLNTEIKRLRKTFFPSGNIRATLC